MVRWMVVQDRKLRIESLSGESLCLSNGFFLPLSDVDWNLRGRVIRRGRVAGGL